MTNPSLLVLDEATEGLAPLIREEIWTMLDHLKQTGLSILLVDKNLDELARISDQYYVIEKGKIVWHGDAATFDANRAEVAQFLHLWVPDKLLLLVELGNQKFGKLYGFLERLLFLEY